MRKKISKAEIGARTMDSAQAIWRNYMLQPNITNIRVISPRHAENLAASNRNVFRFLPAMDPETKAIIPYRTKNGDQTLWMAGYHIASIFSQMGESQSSVSFIIADPLKYLVDGAFDQTEYMLEVTSSPAYVLYNAIETAVRRGSNPNWAYLVRPADGGIPVMPRPDYRYLALGLVISHKSYPAQDRPYGVKDDEPLFLINLPAGVGRLLRDTLDSDEWINKDAVDLDKGLIIAFDPDRSYSGYKSYKPEIMDSYKGIPASLSRYKEEILKKMRPIEDILYFPSIKEQVELLCSTCIPADALVYGLQDRFRDYIPESIYAAAENIARGLTAPASHRSNVAGSPGVSFDQEQQDESGAFVIEDAPFDIPEEYKAALRAAEEKRRRK